MTKIHLTVIQNDGETNAAVVCDDRIQAVWNDNFLAFRPVRLRWWDDASYREYQAADPNELNYPEVDDWRYQSVKG